MSLNDSPQTVIIGNVAVARLSRQQWIQMMIDDCSNARSQRVATKFMTSANGHVISFSGRNNDFKSILAQADGIDADGMPLVFASRWFTPTPLPERVATTDLFHDAATAASQHGISFYLLGATEGENRKAARAVQCRYPNLRIAGRHHGYFSAEEEKDIVNHIVSTKTDILWVGLGVPREQAFIERNLKKMEGVAWAKTCGGLMNFLSGTRKRAPRWMQASGVEWVYRTVREPRRLLWRYLTSSVHASYLAARHTYSTSLANFAFERTDDGQRRLEQAPVPNSFEADLSRD